MDFEKMKMMERHATVVGPLIKLYNKRWSSATPGVAQQAHPEHSAWVKTTNKITSITQEIWGMIAAGDL